MIKVKTFQMASWDEVHFAPWEQQKRLTINVMNQLELEDGGGPTWCVMQQRKKHLMPNGKVE
jgi:hypothetical protein